MTNRRNPFRSVRVPAIVVVCAMLAGCVQHNARDAPSTTVILVRHADRADLSTADPPLTPAGLARANELASALHYAGIQAIITTQYERTKATAAPLAALLRLTPIVIADRDSAHARDVARTILARHAGETVLVVGHGHTVPAIIEELGARRPRAICESTFDELFVVTIPSVGVPRLITARYGAPSPSDSSCTRIEGSP